MNKTIKTEDIIDIKQEAATNLSEMMFDEIKLKEEFKSEWDHVHSTPAKTKTTNEDKSHLYFECIRCKKVFLCHNDLLQHLEYHTDLQLFECTPCNKIFKCIYALKSHLKLHSNIKPFKCGICERNFVTNATLKQHVKIHIKRKPIKCEECGSRFFSEKLFKSHEKKHVEIHEMIHTIIKPEDCSLCKKNLKKTQSDTETVTKLQWDHDYMKQTNMQSFKCSLCYKTFKDIGFLSLHLKIHSGVRPFVCGICNKDFILNSSLKEHAAMHKEVRSYECDQCHLSYLTRKGLRTHIQTHIKTHFKCRLCSKRFKADWLLDLHLKSHVHTTYSLRDNTKTHSTKSEAEPSSTISFDEIKVEEFKSELNDTESQASMECIYCNEVFYLQADMVQHFNKHVELEPFECDLCFKRYVDAPSLNNHTQSHLNIDQYKCGDCDKGFVSSLEFEQHVVTHNDDYLLQSLVKIETFSDSEFQE
ncbi:hypothetical protein RN001_011069 [Aquatica leii]|uniref:C2H2-type domain-containing protein n=1 Tax=Aquatica leii TaxID=1421715 RepID=A0AAN7SNL3_9COLE|nr:hypothetical protein RN001_011069 [Aquatica leii]